MCVVINCLEIAASVGRTTTEGKPWRFVRSVARICTARGMRSVDMDSARSMVDHSLNLAGMGMGGHR